MQSRYWRFARIKRGANVVRHTIESYSPRPPPPHDPRDALVRGDRWGVVRFGVAKNHSPNDFTNLLMSLVAFFQRSPLGKAIPRPGVILDVHNGVMPDMVVLRNKRMIRSSAGWWAPEIMVEILSPGSENEDRHRITKRRLYGDVGWRNI